MSKHTIDRRAFFALTAAGGGAVFMSGLFGQAQAADGMAMPYDKMNGKFIVKAWTEAPCVC